MSGSNPRKRPAPGASSAAPLAQMQNAFPNSVGGNMARWNGAVDNSGLDAAPQGANAYGLIPGQGQYLQGAQGVPNTSNALARRQNSQALVAANGRGSYDASLGAWVPFAAGEDPLLQQPSNGSIPDHDNVEALEETAQKAKREAIAKRKQIPPFVQKLSSFLDEKKNEELIRWSENGDSFIVLDEDEFAKTLIPELFKHNNYASFVRQLNMYGFHKRVGLSDNSMRASERKNKSPSEYSNPYFRRGHPNLLWLITKAKSGGKGKKPGKATEVDVDSEEDIGVDDPIGTAPGDPSAAANDFGTLQKKDVTMLREELAKVREQNKQIVTAIQRLQANNQQLYNQAMMFQSQHERHQNSINAILNFLANVFRKTLEDQGGASNMNELLSSIIPNSQMGQHTVVDLGDYDQARLGVSTPMGMPKRSRPLLPPIPNQSKANTVASTPASTYAASPYTNAGTLNPDLHNITEVFDTPTDTTSPNYLQELESNPQEEMMKLINNTNAYSNSGIDLPDVVHNTSATLTDEQRTKMLNLMAQSQANAAPSVAGSSTAARTQRPSSAGIPAVSTSNSAGQLSPITPTNPLPPSLQQIGTNQDELAAIHRMQEQHGARIEELSNFLGPLSPSGRIPGLDDTDPGSIPGYFTDNSLDIDQFLDSDAFLEPGASFSGQPFGGADGNDFNFSLDGDGAGAAAHGGLEPGHVIDGGSAADTPSPADTEEIPREELETPSRNSKRRRVG